MYVRYGFYDYPQIADIPVEPRRKCVLNTLPSSNYTGDNRPMFHFFYWEIYIPEFRGDTMGP